jgi:hypothetical protein
MKKLFLAFLILGILFIGATAFAQFQTLTQISVGNNTPGLPLSTGTIRGSSVYTASGNNTERGTAYTSAQQGNLFLKGVGAATLYLNAAGAIVGQEEITLSHGDARTLTKVGASTLVTSVDENNDQRLNGELWETAAGFSTSLSAKSPGTGAIISAAYTTAPAIVAQYQFSGLLDTADIKAGAIARQTTGYGPITPTSPGERFSAVTQYGEQHWVAGTFNYGGKLPPAPITFNVAISFNKTVSVLPPIVPPVK